MISRMKREGVVISGVVIGAAPFSHVSVLSNLARHRPASVG
jgi:hypothetical protein